MISATSKKSQNALCRRGKIINVVYIHPGKKPTLVICCPRLVELVRLVGYELLVNPLNQGSPSSVLEGRCPAEFSSNPNQTHLKQLIKLLLRILETSREVC